VRLSQGAQPTDAVRFLLEKGGLLEKTVRPAETIGKLKQAAAREAAVKQAAKDAAEAKAAEAAAASESDDSATESTES
jgi:small subunit ribosomal protein S16